MITSAYPVESFQPVGDFRAKVVSAWVQLILYLLRGDINYADTRKIHLLSLLQARREALLLRRSLIRLLALAARLDYQDLFMKCHLRVKP